jgi:DNA-binding MarR family transcriptional regulator
MESRRIEAGNPFGRVRQYTAGMEKKALRRGLRSDLEHPWRHDNLGRLLLASVINWQDVLVAGLQKKGFRNFRASHMNLLRHIDFEGTRISEIARRSRVSKQTVGELIAGCEAERLVKIVPDSTDGRAKIVMFTSLGKSIIVAEREIMEEMDARLARALGRERLDGLRDTLSVLAKGGTVYAGAPAGLPKPEAPKRARQSRRPAARAR